jgi:ABC-type multidrug transport system fused ATPase/permease subunit
MGNSTWLSDGVMKFSTSGIDFRSVHPLQRTCQIWNSRKDLYLSLDPQSLPSGPNFAEVFGLLFFVCFVLIQIVILIFCWIKYRKVVNTQNAIEVFDQQNLSSSSVECSCSVSDEAYYSTLSYPEPLEVACENLCVKFNNNIILSDFTASFASGSFTGIMGPSGCGKTTLLTALRGGLQEYSTGDIFIGFKNIIDISPDAFTSIFGFVSQHNPPFWGLSCRELLNYYAFLLVNTIRY